MILRASKNDIVTDFRPLDASLTKEAPAKWKTLLKLNSEPIRLPKKPRTAHKHLSGLFILQMIIHINIKI